MPQIKKITAKNVYGKLARKKVHNLEGEPLWMFTVFGQARRMVTGEADYGPYIRFRGTFEAANLETGEVFTSSNLIMPPIVEEEIEDALSVDGVESADFAIKVGVRADEESATGYVYVFEPLLQRQATDPLEAIRQHLIDDNLLPAPEPESEPKPELETKPKPAKKPSPRTKGARK